MITVYKSGDISEAHIIAGLLNSHDIPAHIDGLYLQGGIGDLAVNDFVSVKVSEQDAERARQVIAEYEDKQVDSVENTADQAKKPNSIAKFLLFLVVTVVVSLFLFSVLGQ